MNALRRMDDYDPQNGIPRATAPVSVFNRRVEATQSASVVLNRYLWQDSLLRMPYDDTSITKSSAVIAKEEVQRVDGLRKREAALRWLEIWREEDAEKEQQEVIECSRLDLGEGGFC